jgi:hypothetical protein
VLVAASAAAVAVAAVAAFALLPGDDDPIDTDGAAQPAAAGGATVAAPDAVTVTDAPLSAAVTPEPTAATPTVAPPAATPAETTPPPEQEPGEPDEDPSGEPPDRDVSFTAYFTYGESTENPPFEEYFGSAPGESEIEITSAYGSGETVTELDGYWHLTVEFPTAPVGQPFAVTITNEAGSATYQFTRTA